MRDMGLGDARDVYSAWVDQVRRDGGVPTVMPDGSGHPAARYPATVWVPKVNGRVWPMPDTYGGNGQYAYYRASNAVAESAKALTDPNEVKMKNPLDAIGEVGETIATAAKWGVVAILIAKGLDLLTARERNKGANRA